MKKLKTLFSIAGLFLISFTLTSNFIFKPNNDVINSQPEVTTTVTYQNNEGIETKTTKPTIHTKIVSYTDTTLKFHYIIDSRGSDSVGKPYEKYSWAVYPNSTSTVKMTATGELINSNDQLITVTKLTPNTKYSTLTMSATFIDSKTNALVTVKSTIETFTTYPAGYVPPKETNLLWLWIIIAILIFILIIGGGYYSYKSGLINDQYKKYSKQINTQIKKYKK